MSSTHLEDNVKDLDDKHVASHLEYSSDGKALDPTVSRDLELATSTSANYAHRDSAFERKLMRKIDLRLVPALAFMYGCSLIDRTNLPVARLAGLDKAIGTNVGDRYSIVTLLFFIPYILTEIPGNYALKRGVPPRIWLPSMTLGFGVFMIAFGFVTNWWTLAILRLPLGALEGCLFPGCVFLISSWYPRYETQKRISAFYLSGSVFSGFGNIIAYGFSLMAGQQGKAGWSWIFIMMGVLTCIAAVVGYCVVPNFPAKATFLTEEERKLVHDRITVDRHDYEDEKLTMAIALKSLGNWKIWSMGVLFCCSTLPAYAFAFFLSLILKGFGFTTKQSFLLSAPPYVCAITYGMIVGYFADRMKIRGPFIIMGALISLTGSLIVGYGHGNGVRYFGSFLAIMGCQSNIPTVMSWSVNSIRGYGPRAISSAIVVAGGGLGGIVASVSFREKDAKTGYRPGLWTTVAAQFTIIIITIILMMFFKAKNAAQRRGDVVLEGHPGFLYTL